MGTFVPSGKDIDRKWFVVDANGKTLGRLATKAADLLSGKLNPQYVPYIDMGDHVIVINAEKVRLVYPPSEPQAGDDPGAGHQGHAAQEQDRPPDGDQAEGVSRRQASPPGAGAGGDGDQVKPVISCQ